MAQSSTLAKRRWFRKDGPSKGRSWVMRWRDESRPPKKRGADPRLYVWTQERKSRTQRTPAHERRRRGRLHTPLLEMHVRRRWFLCGGCSVGRRGHAIHQDGAEALLSAGGGDVICVRERTYARDV